jgi:hypothetical protein
VSRFGTLDYLTKTLPEGRGIDRRNVVGLQESSELLDSFFVP